MAGTPRAAERVIFVGWMAVFAAAASVIPMVAVVMSSAGPRNELGGSRLSLIAHNLAMCSPFLLVAVGFWAYSFKQLARVRLPPAGLAAVRQTPAGWEAVFPSAVAGVVEAVVFTAVVFATAAAPLYTLGKRNPLWVWAVALPVAAGLAAATRRRLLYRPAVVIDEAARTVTLPRGRRMPPVTAPWGAVRGVEVVRRLVEESGDEYDCVVTVQADGKSEVVHLWGEDHPEAAERFAAWLRERLEPRGDAPFPRENENNPAG